MLPNINKVEVSLDYGELTSIVNWCERNCNLEWGYECTLPAGRDAGMYDFYFQDEKDLLAFIIWKT